MTRRIPLSVLVGIPTLCLAAGGALGWFTDFGRETAQTTQSNGEPLPAVFDAVAPVHALNTAPTPLDNDESQVIGVSQYLDPASAIEVPAAARLEIGAGAVDQATLQPAPAVVPTPFPLGEASAMDSVTAELSPAATGVVREAQNASPPASALRVSAPFAATGVYASLCNEVQAGAVPDPELEPALRPTLAVFVNQPSTIAISGTWADGATLEKSTMVTLPAHDVEWQRRFDETGEQATILACFALPLDDVRVHADAGVARLRASVLAINATGQADLNATVVLNVVPAGNDPFFVDAVTFTSYGEQLRADGRLYPTIHVHYAFIAEAVVPAGSTLLPAQARVFADHEFVEGADCAGWAANQQGIERTDSGRFSVRTETRNVAGRERAVTAVDGDVYLDPRLPGGWQGSFCVRLQVTDQHGAQQSTLALRGAQVRSPRTASYDVGVALNATNPPTAPVDVAWSSTNGGGCAAVNVLNGLGAQCEFMARAVPDGIVVRLTTDEGSALIRVPVNTAYCNPDDPLDPGNGCSEGFVQTFDIPFAADGPTVQVTLHVVRRADPGVMWDDPSNAWAIGAIG